MSYENRVCCFIDILGFKEHIDETIQNSVENTYKIAKIQNIIVFIQELIYDLDNETSKSKVVTQFSDSVVISFRIEEKSEIISTLVTLLYVAFECANEGFFIRGGVSYGKLIHNNSMVFGPALNEAYYLESKKAFFPRIIINNEITSLALRYIDDSHEQPSIEKDLRRLVVKDDDGQYYIEYMSNAVAQLNSPVHHLPEYMNNLRKFIVKGLNHKEQSVVDKYDWLKAKYNHFARPIVSKVSNQEFSYDDDFTKEQYEQIRLI